MSRAFDRWALTGAAAGAWLPGLFLLRYFAHVSGGRNGSGASAFVAFAAGLCLCLLLLRLVWWLPYRSARAWMWTSVSVLAVCGFVVWVGTALDSSVTVELGNDLLGSALWGLVRGAPLAIAYGAICGTLLGLVARAGGAQGGPSERPRTLAVACAALALAGAAAIAFFIARDSWPGPS